MSISLAIFQTCFARKNWRGGVESLLKNGTIDGYAYQKHVIPGPGLQWVGVGPLALSGFLQHLSAKYK